MQDVENRRTGLDASLMKTCAWRMIARWNVGMAARMPQRTRAQTPLENLCGSMV